MQPQPASQLQNSRYVPESVQSAISFGELDAEAAYLGDMKVKRAAYSPAWRF